MSRPAAWPLLLAAMPLLAAAAPTPRVAFTGSGDPEATLLPLDAEARRVRNRGLALFNTDHVVAGTEGAAAIDGLGPVYNAASCDACHNAGHRARGPIVDGLVPLPLVIQLGPPRGDAKTSPYGAVLNAQALPGVAVEGRATLQFDHLDGHYPDGQPWRLRRPRYPIDAVARARLPAGTVIRPRIAPPVFGMALIEAARLPSPGRFGWQAAVPSLAEQTAIAYAHEMGITSRLRPQPDCGTGDRACLEAANGGVPEVADRDFDAVLALQRSLPVPAEAPLAADAEAAGRALFIDTGCSGCHVVQLPVDGIAGLDTITAWSDLRSHDLGPGLADRDLADRPQPTRFRTAPLWGLAAARAKAPLLLLHDGRAASVAEAILWHDGEASAARAAFEKQTATARALLIRWVEGR